MSKHARLRALFIAACISFLAVSLRTAAACEGGGDVRLQVRLYLYDGVSDQSFSKDAFQRFHRFLSQKIKHLRDIVGGPPDGRAEYLLGLRIAPDVRDHSKVSAAPKDKLLGGIWEYYADTLLILTGSINGDLAMTEFYWGELSPPPLGPYVSAHWVFSADDFHRVVDTHSLIVLVALGQELIRRKCSSNVVQRVFFQAYGIVQDLAKRDGGLSGDTALLRSFIDKQIGGKD